ncbi:hypothetical protein GJ496_002043 [Pomphorhynchus laevis]|nr:hypothetical protein GJ496_002043 [Pomphorhynchus laevis]
MQALLPSIFRGFKSTQYLSAFKRSLNLYEYQSKKLLADNGIDVQRFKMAENASEAANAAGGRGKGHFMSSKLKGGIQLTKNADIVHDMTSKMIGDYLVTKQTGKDGVLVTKLMIAEALDIVKETYLAILLDRNVGGPVIVASPCGGVDIEEVAESQPHNIIKVPVDIVEGLSRKDAEDIANKLQFSDGKTEIIVDQIQKLYELFNRYDCTMLEINPFGETPDGRIVCFDAKIVFDESAAYRHKHLFETEDTSELDQRELRATQLGLNFVSLGDQGSIGCMVNGAGLAMATMDVIKLHGGEPANFLDLGGTVGEDQVSQALQLLQSDPKVKSILINIFGGIVNCDTIANGIVSACKAQRLQCPLVVRLQGTNVDSARATLAKSGLKIINASDLSDAASKAVNSLSKAN